MKRGGARGEEGEGLEEKRKKGQGRSREKLEMRRQGGARSEEGRG